MNILLISNAPTPQICNEIGTQFSPKEGWVTGLVEGLKKTGQNIYFVFPHRLGNKVISGGKNGFYYYGYPKSKSKDWEFESIHEKYFYDIFKKIGKIDVIHIMGSEMGHTLSAVRAAQKIGELSKTIISIQGLVSIYEKHYYANLDWKTVNFYTVRDFIKQDNIRQGRKAFKKRGKYEIEAFQTVGMAIGRTDWDKACVQLMNPSINYYFCNEILRKEFYSGEWNYEKCEKHTIFMSQGNYPIKGLHYMLDALNEIKKRFPDVKLRITGSDYTEKTWLELERTSYYFVYIVKQIKKYDLSKNVEFLGTLDAEEMKREYLRANVFVSASSIENSPNSVGEAMILGTPVVSSDVGGVKNLLEHNKEGFIYQHDASYMLAYYVMKLFENCDQAREFSFAARKHANRIYSVQNNIDTMMNIYRDIAKVSSDER